LNANEIVAFLSEKVDKQYILFMVAEYSIFRNLRLFVKIIEEIRRKYIGISSKNNDKLIIVAVNPRFLIQCLIRSRLNNVYALFSVYAVPKTKYNSIS